MAFCASVFHIFIEYMRPQEKYEIFSGLPLGQVSIGLLVVGSLVSGTGVSFRSPVMRWTAVFLIWSLVTALLSSSLELATEAYWEAVKVVGVYFFIAAALQNRRQLYFFIAAILLLYLLHTNFAVRGWVLSGFSGLPKGAYVGSGFFRNPNDFGAALAGFWGVSLLLSTIDTGKLGGPIRLQWLHIGNTLLFLASVLTSSSRGAAIAVAAGALFYVKFYVSGTWQKALWISLAVIAAFGFLYFLSEGQSDRFEIMGSDSDESAQDRFRTWAVAWSVFLDHPVTGVGIGQFLEVAYFYAPNEKIFVQHNIFLQALTETGATGLVLLLTLLGSFFLTQRCTLRRLKSSPRRDKILEAIVIGTSVSMFSFIVAGQFITVLFYPFMWVLIMISASADVVSRYGDIGNR